MRTLTALAVTLLALAAAGTAGAQNPTLTATVGPEATITLTDASGAPVSRIDPGTYTIVVRDRSPMHNFRLQGPGVNVATTVEEVVDTSWTVSFQDGSYTFICDPHSGFMRGTFTVGAAAPPAPATTTTTTPARPAAPRALAASVGPGFTIRMTGTRNLRAGAVVLTVADRAAAHNFHLMGPGVNRKTTVPFTGTATWRLRLQPGTYRFVCDPHAAGMKGSFRVTA